MKKSPIPVVGGSYSDDAKPFTSQDTQNWLPVLAEGPGTRSPSMLRTPPGLQEFSTVGTQHRGAREVEGRYFGVSGTKAFQLFPSGDATQIGTVPGTGRVSISHNQIAGGNQVKFVNGSAGYIYDTITEAFTRITDASYPGEIITKYIGQRFIGIEPQRRYVVVSDLVDGLSYNSVNEFEGESSPDRLVTLEPIHGEVVVFSDRTTEHFAYTGAQNDLFQNKIITIDLGCASAHCVSNIDNRLFFVGSDGSGYFLDGYTPVRITTHAIEQAWARCDRSKCFAYPWEDRGHKVWYVTFPDGMTWGYDCSTKEWHRRQTYGLDRWRLATLVKWNGGWYGGDYNSGMIWRLDWDYVGESTDPMVRRRRTGVGHDNQNIITAHSLELVFDTGLPSSARVLGAMTIVGDVPDGAVNDAVATLYQAYGGLGPYTYAVTGGTFPAGLTLAADGTVTGSYTTAATYSWEVAATDTLTNTASMDDTAVVSAAAAVPTTMDVIVTQGTGGFALVTYTPATAGQVVVGFTDYGRLFQSRPFMMQGDVIVHYTNQALDWEIAAYRPSDYAISGWVAPSGYIVAGEHATKSAVKLSDTRLITLVFGYGAEAGLNYAKLYEYDATQALSARFIQLDVIPIADDVGVPGIFNGVELGGKAIFATATGKYIIVTNTADELSVSYSSIVSPTVTDMCSTGTHVALSNGQFLSHVGSDMVLVQSTAAATTGCAFDGTRVLYTTATDIDGVMGYRSAISPFTYTEIVTPSNSHPGAGSGIIFLPADIDATYFSGYILTWTGSYSPDPDFQFTQWSPVSDIAKMAATVVREVF